MSSGSAGIVFILIGLTTEASDVEVLNAHFRTENIKLEST